LNGGANDICGTGSINAVDSVLETAGKEAPKVSQEVFDDVIGCIESAGFTPARRSPRYELLEVFAAS
jgi:2-iminoacetate synthase ThiH